MPFSFFRNHSQQQIEDLLLAHADALADGSVDLDTLLEQYTTLTASQVEGLLLLAERISSVLTEVKPSDTFVSQLRYELSHAGLPEDLGFWMRLRHLSPRTQLAAASIGGATLAGVVLIASRPLWEMVGIRRNRRTAIA
ncbi:MAG: hypothetical protein GYB65_11645 [Chloroflexi bacterium]|nr:hypothetical protein [Chloroflexota bacterium]